MDKIHVRDEIHQKPPSLKSIVSRYITITKVVCKIHQIVLYGQYGGLGGA